MSLQRLRSGEVMPKASVRRALRIFECASPSSSSSGPRRSRATVRRCRCFAMSASDVAIVSVYGVRVGHLHRVSEYSDFSFRFDPAWLVQPHRPVLGQLFEDRLPDPIETSGLVAWFAHLLPPPGLARRLIRRWRGAERRLD